MMTIAILCALLLAVAVLAIQSCCRRLVRVICRKGKTTADRVKSVEEEF